MSTVLLPLVEEEEMGEDRTVLQRWQTRRLLDHQEGTRAAYVLYETAWADAWPHLDNWFKTDEALLLPGGRNRSM